MKVKYMIAASALVFASCSSDDFMGNTPGNTESNNVAINFGGSTGKITRASDKEGKDAADALSNNFIVFGTKTVNGTKTVVYDHYNVVYADSKWEYAGKPSNSLNNTKGTQSLKYWDYSASQYDFIAFSLGGMEMGEGVGQIKVTRITDNENPTYTLSGKISDLQGCFIANKISKTETDYNKNVEFIFRSTGTKVAVSIYEMIPGYSIKY